MQFTSGNAPTPCLAHAYCTGQAPTCTGELGFNIACEPTAEVIEDLTASEVERLRSSLRSGDLVAFAPERGWTVGRPALAHRREVR